MELPKLPGLEVLESHDYGGCGEVFLAEGQDGARLALKTLDDLSVSRALLARMHDRLAADGWPEGVMPLAGCSLENRPLYLLMPWLAEQLDDESWRPCTMQHHLDEFPREDSWDWIRQLAAILGRMHARHVPHGNLKPGNLFFDPEGQLLVSDWCLGNMPGVHVFHFTDALLYQPPEQLRDSSGYLDEQGYGWDVYAFGVISYRLLTGRFPRCDEVFQKVAPPAGKTRCDGLRADPDKVAQNLEQSEIAGWPVEAADELEERQREWIIRCLHMDPAQRPATMTEVAAAFEVIEREVEQENRYRREVALHRRSRRRVAALLVALGICAVAIVVLTGLWRRSGQQLATQAREIRVERTNLKQQVAMAKAAEAGARDAEAAAKQALSLAKAHYLTHLGASRQAVDLLFAWAMEKDRRQLPPLDGRDKRLHRLQADLEKFVAESGGREELQEVRARAQLQLAEIAISLGQAQTARQRFDAARQALADADITPELSLRMATDSLLIAKLLQGSAEPGELMRSFHVARALLTAVDRNAVDPDRLDQLLAVLDYRQAKLQAQQGDREQALVQLMRATETLNRISAKRPEVAILHSALADCYLSSASLLEDIGKPGDAREVRMLAVGELLELRKADPRNLEIQDQLAACYAAMAEACFLSGDLEGAAQRCEESLGLLKGYLAQRPRDENAVVRRAALFALQAGIQRDLGEAETALELYNSAQAILETVTKRQPEHALARYRLALVWWQKGRMLGMNDNQDAEVALLVKAASTLEDLEKQDGDAGPGREQLLRSQAYLAGDLGHARELGGDRKTARAALQRAVGLWQQLRAMRPHSEEYLQAEEWCRERLQRLDS